MNRSSTAVVLVMVSLAVAFVAATPLAVTTEPTDLPLHWSTTLLSKEVMGMEDYGYLIRNAGQDVTAMLLSPPFPLTNKQSYLFTVNSTTGEKLKVESFPSPPNSVLAGNVELGLVAYYNQKNSYCVARSASLEALWCTPFVSACMVEHGTGVNQFRYPGCAFEFVGASLIIADNGIMMSFHAITGKQQWKTTIPFLPKYQEYQSVETVTLAARNDDATTVVVSYFGLFAFNVKTGALDYTYGVDLPFSPLGSLSPQMSPIGSVTADGDVVAIVNSTVLLISSEGKPVRNYTVPGPGVFDEYPTQAVVHPHTTEIVVLVDDNSDLPFGGYNGVFMIDANNKLKWNVTSQNQFSAIHLDVATNSIFYMTTGSGLIQRDLSDGRLLSVTPSEQICQSGGQPMISVDKKTAMAPACPQDQTGYESLVGYFLQ